MNDALLTPKTLMKRLLPRTLFGRSLLIIVTPVLLLQIILTVVFIDRHWSAMTSRLADAVAGEIAMLSEDLETANNQEAIDQTLRQFKQHTQLAAVYHKGADLNERHTESWIPGTDQTFAEAMGKFVGRPFNIVASAEEKTYQVDVGLKTGVIHVVFPERRLSSSTTYIFILWMLGSALILFAIAIAFMRNQIRPIRRLAMAADRFGKGLNVPRFKPEGAAEVRQAAVAFQDMRERIQRQIEQRTAMLAGVSHDLRTPLTRMKLQLAMLGDSPDAEALKRDIEEMERMVEGYLTFARGEGDEVAEARDLSDILFQVADAARRNGSTAELETEKGLILRVRPNAMERCLANLVSNACKYGEKVWVNARRDTSAIVISIEDDGPGIPEDMTEQVFRPFFRVEESRNPATGGVGLGLSIAQDIIHSHGGMIALESSEEHGGLKVVIRLPA